METEPLLHAELVAPERGYSRILLPEEIPLHPTVLKADFAYTRQFVDEVRLILPEEIRKDVSEIERMLNTRLNIRVTYEYVSFDVPNPIEYRFDMFTYLVDPRKRSVNVQCGSANIGIDDNERTLIKEVYPFNEHPMRPEKLRQYALPGENAARNVFWYIHNISDGILPLELYFRNFAITFNNRGLKRIEQHGF